MNLPDMTPDRVRLEERYAELKMLRSSVSSYLEDARRFIRPNGTDFSLDRTFGGHKDNDSVNLYDDTAVWANQMFANGLTSYLMPKADRWAFLKPAHKSSSELTDEELVYLEAISDRIFHEFTLPSTRFYSTGHMTFLDVGSYGTAAIYVSKGEQGSVVNFRSCPLADTFFDLDHEGRPDTVYYRRFLSTKAMVQRFPDVVNQEGFDPKSQTQTWELVYSVEPNRDVKSRTGGRIGGTRPFRVTFWCPRLKHVLEEGGLTYFPFLIPRWAVTSGQVYGLGPSNACIANIRVLNKLVKELLISAEITNAPPMWAEDESILLPEYGPRKWVWGQPGSEPPQPIMSGSQPNITLEMIESYRAAITRSYFVDQIMREQKKERQSVLEIQDERGQMLQQLGPLLSRQEEEFLSPAIEMTFQFLARARQFPDPPESLTNAALDIVYTSPAAHAQYAGKLGDISAFLQDIVPLAQVKPDVMDAINDTELVDHYARYRSVPRKVINSKKAIAEIREQRAQAEEMQQTAQMAPEMSGAVKDIAHARQMDPEGIGQLLNI